MRPARRPAAGPLASLLAAPLDDEAARLQVRLAGLVASGTGEPPWPGATARSGWSRRWRGARAEGADAGAIAVDALDDEAAIAAEGAARACPRARARRRR
ncbi:MAG: hypothetical protein R2939_14045 [Kofleriaceae bacterium]